MKYGLLAYGLFHRDVLQLAIDENMTRQQMLIYSWLLPNANQWNGQLTQHPTLNELSTKMRISRRHLGRIFDIFADYNIFHHDTSLHHLDGFVVHIPEVRREDRLFKAREALRREDPSIELPGYPESPIGLKFYAQYPSTVVKIAAKHALSKMGMLIYWWILFNSAPKGHLTANTTLEELRVLLSSPKRKKPIHTRTLLRGLSELRELELFYPEPTKLQGRAHHIPEALERAQKQAQTKQRNKAYRAYIKKENEDCEARLGRKLYDAEIKALKTYFYENYEKVK